MENASKALLIAGGILISILVLSIGVYLFANFVNMSSSYEQTRQTTAIQQFNAKFTTFEGREDITIHEIITLANFAKQYEKETGIHVEVYLGLVGDITNEENYINLIKENSLEANQKKEYIFRNIKYDNQGRVNYIKID